MLGNSLQLRFDQSGVLAPASGGAAARLADDDQDGNRADRQERRPAADLHEAPPPLCGLLLGFPLEALGP